jgi:FkbM family methyltransferase
MSEQTAKGMSALGKDGETPVEFRFANIEDVRYAYRLLLGREPDEEGMEHHMQTLSKRRLTPVELANAFLSSPEFAARSHGLPIEVVLDGYSVFVQPEDRDIGRHVEATHQYEPHVTAAVRECLRPGHVFVDVGANIGFFTNLAAYLVGESGMVIAVEPMDKNLQLIYRSIERNGFKQVRVHACAASDRTQIVCVATGAGTSNGQILPASMATQQLFTQAKPLDPLLTDLERIDLVKLDIEGYELLAWRGLRHALVRHRPKVLTEFHPYCMCKYVGVEPLDYLAMLFAHGRVKVLHHQGGETGCATPAEVMRQWEIADKSMRGDGTHHLDLLINPIQ